MGRDQDGEVVAGQSQFLPAQVVACSGGDVVKVDVGVTVLEGADDDLDLEAFAGVDLRRDDELLEDDLAIVLERRRDDVAQ